MKNVKKILLTAFSFWSIAVSAQTNSTSIPINANPAATPPPVQTPPPTPQTGPPINKVMLKSQVDSMDSKKRATPRPTQNIYPDSTRQLIHKGDTETVPVRK